MNEQIFKGQWKEVKGKLKKQWGKLTESELDEIQGNNQQIYGLLQKHYGYAKDEVTSQVNDFMHSMAEKADHWQAQGGKLLAALSEQVSDLSCNVKKLSSKGGQVVSEQVQERPLAAVGIAVTAGLILGYLLGRK